MARSGTSSWIRMIPVVLGLLGILAMLAMAAVAGYFMVWHYALGGLSLLCAAVGLFWLQDVKWRETLLSLVYTFFFALCVVLVYMISANRQMRLDITKNKLHTLSAQTESVLRDLPPDETFHLEVFATQERHQALQRFLNNYRRIAPQVEFHLYDPARDLDVTAQYDQRITDGDMVITRTNQRGEALRQERATLGTNPAGQENALTNALLRTLRNEQGVVYMTSGHGERPLDDSEFSMRTISERVNSIGFDVAGINLLEVNEIPEDATALVIAGPTMDLFDPEREVIERYLDEGGKLMLLYDPILERNRSMPNLELLLEKMGVESPNRLVVDPVSLNASNSTFTPLVQYIQHPITETADTRPFLLNQARPFLPLDNVPTAEVAREGVLVTHEKVWTEGFDELRSVRRPIPPEDASEIAPQFMAITVEIDTPGGKYGNRMRALLVGDSDAFVNQYVETNGSAGSFYLNAISWLREERSLLYIPQKVFSTTPLIMSSTNYWILFGFFMVAGLAITVGGTAITIVRRRNK